MRLIQRQLEQLLADIRDFSIALLFGNDMNMLNCIIIACSAFQRLSYNPSPYIGLVRGMQLCCAIVSHQY